jgi:hypothetical protein
MGAVGYPQRTPRIPVAGAIVVVFGVLLGGGALILALLGAIAGQESGGLASDEALADIPANYLEIYRSAGQRYGLGSDGWSYLAAIGSIETDHGRSGAAGVRSGVNFAGCCAGPMQFNIRNGPPSTWDGYKTDGDEDGRIDVYDPADAIPAAAKYLRASGAPKDWRKAIFAYNHADWYVADVMEKAAAYRVAPPLPGTGSVSGSTDATAVLRNPKITLTPVQRADLSRGLIDPRVIAILDWIGRRHDLVVTALRSDHYPGTNHGEGRAVDIGAVDRQRCIGTREGACGQLAVQLAAIRGPLHSTELIYCFDPDGAASPDAFARADHCDHIHWGLDR